MLGTEGAFLLAAVPGAISAEKLGLWRGCAGAVLVLLSLLADELGHLAVAQFLGVKVHAIGIWPRVPIYGALRLETWGANY